MASDINKWKHVWMTPEEMSEQFFYGIVPTNDIEKFVKESNLKAQTYNDDEESRLYSVFECAEHFDPFNTLHGPVLHIFENLESEEDILELAQTIVRDANQELPPSNWDANCYIFYGVDDAWNFKDKNFIKSGDTSFPFLNQKLNVSFTKLTAERYLYTALLGYIWSEAPIAEQDGDTLWEAIKSLSEPKTYDDSKNAVELLFDELEEENPDHFAVIQFNEYKFLRGFLNMEDKYFLGDMVEWLLEKYYSPLGFWGIREREFLRFYRMGKEKEEQETDKSKKGRLSWDDDRQYWGSQEMISKGTAYDYGALSGNSGHRVGAFWKKYSENKYDWFKALESEDIRDKEEN